MEEHTFRRGDVVLVPFPYVSDYTQSKSRPAAVIQNEMANQYNPNLILALISSTVPAKHYPMHYRIKAKSAVGRASGLKKDSIVKAEVIVTMSKKAVLQKIGAFPPEALQEIDQCLRISLAL